MVIVLSRYIVILDAIFAFILYRLFGEAALWILGITCLVSFLRVWWKIDFVNTVYKNSLLSQTYKQEDDEYDKQN